MQIYIRRWNSRCNYVLAASDASSFYYSYECNIRSMSSVILKQSLKSSKPRNIHLSSNSKVLGGVLLPVEKLSGNEFLFFGLFL